MRKPATKHPPGATGTRPGQAWLWGLLLVLATFLAYQPVWHAGFIWDDDAYVTENINLRTTAGLVRIWCEPSASPQYYPLVHTSFWVEHHLWSINPLGYHVVNVFLHTLAALLLWRVLLQLEVPAAWLAATVFALHPVQVESVAWVTERKNVLSAVFYFAAALAYWRWDPLRRAPSRRQGREDKGKARGSHGWYGIALGLFIAALLSKTVTCSWPAAMLLLIWWKRGCIRTRDVWPLLPFFGAGMALGLQTSWLERTQVGASGPDWAFSLADRCLIAGRAIWFYAGKLFWPARLTFIYPRWDLHSDEWWQWAFPVVAAALVAALWGLRRKIGRGPLVAALYFSGTLFPALGFTNLYPMRYSFVADHFQYLACLGLIVPAVTGLGKILRPLPPWAVLLPLGLGVLTWKQAHIYANLETLWQDTVTKNPNGWMAHNNLAIIYEKQDRTDEAIREYREVLRLKPDDDQTHNSLGMELVRRGELDAGMSEFQEAIRLKPNYALAHNNLGLAFARKGLADEAIGEYEEAIRLKPDDAEAHNNFATALAGKGRMDEAINQFQTALRLNPDWAHAHFNLGYILGLKGEINEAASQYEEAIRLKPDFGDAHSNLGVAYANQGRMEEAIGQFQAALDIKPDDAEDHYNLATALLSKGRFDEAIDHFQAALRLKPDWTQARDGLARAGALKNANGR